MYIEYTALRRLMAGHTEGSLYGFEVAIMQFDDVPIPDQVTNKSLNGTTKSILHRVEDTISLQTVPILEDDTAQMREFLHSVVGGESFIIDPWGTGAVPDAPVSVVLDPVNFAPVRVQRRAIQFSFKVRLL